jgi:hypothetical protein
MKSSGKVFLEIILTILVLARTGASLPSFNEYLIDDDTHGTSSILMCDIDGDGKTDLVASVIEENSMVWFRNEGGMPIQWTKHVIDHTFSAAWGVYAADIDGDGHTDVLGASQGDNQVAWWRNSGASPITWEKHIIRANLPFAHEVYAVDFDSDGHTDVFAAASDCNRILWWRNNGENPITWTEQTIDSTFTGAKSVRVGDIDGDGDNDVVGAAINNKQIAWWRNEGGNPITWTKQLTDSSFFGAHRVQIIDIDKDGHPDILGAAILGNQIAWWRNNGDSTITWTKQIIGSEFFHVCIALAVDLDLDGDLDVLGTAQYGNQLAWWRNDGGAPIVWVKTLIASLTRAWPLDACDLDGDGDIDVFAASSHLGTNEVKWWENRLRGDINDDQNIDISDVVYLLNYLFRGGSAPYPLRDGDVNCDGEVNVSDAIYLLNYLFREGPKPCQ